LAIVNLAPIYIRVLLDGARQIILDKSNHQSWEDFRGSYSLSTINDLKRAIASSHNISKSLAGFICVRHDGNEAAHTADRKDIRLAVLQKPAGAERSSLEKVYDFVFQEDINSRDLNE
jgi:hypothetical protein